jgi:hypothetical protein
MSAAAITIVVLAVMLVLALYFMSAALKKSRIAQAEIKAMRAHTAWHNPNGPDYLKGPCIVVAKGGAPIGVKAPWMMVRFDCERPLEVASLMNISYEEGQQNPKR